jgi:hypothetical protein
MKMHALFLSVFLAVGATAAIGDMVIGIDPVFVLPNPPGADRLVARPPVAGPPGADAPVGSLLAWLAAQGTDLPDVSTSMPEVLGAVPSMSVIRSMDVEVAPEWPSRTDLVSVTVTPKTSVANLRMERYEIDTQGHDVTVNVYWTDAPLPPPAPPAPEPAATHEPPATAPPASSEPPATEVPPTGPDLRQIQMQCGYVVEPISGSPSPQRIGSITNLGSTVGAIQSAEECPVTIPLGMFGPGMYVVYVYSHGVLEGEGSDIFMVR